jgi:hypothetical protein
MAYDPATNEVVLFGGYSNGERGDTWTYNGATWTNRTAQLTTGPPARAAASMAYDQATGQLVLFGGSNANGVLSDTWSYDGAAWTNRTAQLTASPPARNNATLAYDPATSQLVLFGGYDGTSYLADTWTYDGAIWTNRTAQLTASPPARGLAPMAYDSTHSQLVLFGGYTPNGDLSDTWTYDGATWTNRTAQLTASPPAGHAGTMDYAPSTGELLLFGGWPKVGRFPGDTWTYDGASWTNRTAQLATSPPTRADATMTYDQANNQMVLFGGANLDGPLGDTWTYQAVAPDLVIDSLSWKPPAPHPGDGVTFTAVVRNQGTGPTPAGVIVGVGFFVDGLGNIASWSDTDTSSLGPGQSVTLTANGGPLAKNTWTATAGSHSVTAWVDDANRIPESNKQNNQRTATLEVLQPPPDTTTSTTVPPAITTSTTTPPTTTQTTVPTPSTTTTTAPLTETSTTTTTTQTPATTLPSATSTTTYQLPLEPPIQTLTSSATLPHPRSGYWMLGEDGRVYAFGDAPVYGGATIPAGRHAVRLTPSPDSRGYWIVDNQGGIYPFGDAPSLGSPGMTALHTNESITSLSSTKSGKGYWLFSTEGRVFPFGDAPLLGDMAGTRLNGAVLDSIPTTTGNGYYMVAADGGIFCFGDARFYGSMGGLRLNRPVESLVPTSSGNGYWLVASDGGIFAFGGAAFLGSMGGKPLNRPIAGMVRFGDGYLMVASDGGIFNFSNLPFLGSLGATQPARPITAVAPLLI